MDSTLKHGVKYDISKHTPPSFTELQMWKGSTPRTLPYVCIDGNWGNLENATHFSLWPVEEKPEPQKSPRPAIMAAFLGHGFDIEKPFTAASLIVTELKQNGYEITKIADPWQYAPLTNNDPSKVHMPRAFQKSKPVTEVQIYPDPPSVERMLEAQRDYTEDHDAEPDGWLWREITNAGYKVREQEKPKSWEQYLDEDGDFYSDNFKIVQAKPGRNAHETKAVIAWLNHHLKEAND